MSHTSEFELIGRISATVKVPKGITGIGDDCAIIPQREGLDTLVSTDLLIEGRHFLLSSVTPFQLGWKSAAVNISDIAAMGGRPAGIFLSIALPASLAGQVQWTEEFIRGFNTLCSRFDLPLLGGDTSASDDKLFINVTVLGECPSGSAVLRSGAREGDMIYVSGPLGDSAAGLKLLTGGASAPEALIRRHYLPMPRVALGQILRDTPGVHSMMDISDGIASDLRHILDASSGHDRLSTLAAEIDTRALPFSDEFRAVCSARGWDAVELAVSGGEDYELLFTAAPGTTVPEGCVAIGRIVPGDGRIRWIGSDKDYKGFTHF